MASRKIPDLSHFPHQGARRPTQGAQVMTLWKSIEITEFRHPIGRDKRSIITLTGIRWDGKIFTQQIMEYDEQVPPVAAYMLANDIQNALITLTSNSEKEKA
jgi:hypothetical protein